MKIVLIGTAYPYRGGLASFNERLMEQFKEEGDCVEIQTFSLQYPSFLFPGKTQFCEKEASYDFKIERSVSSINPLSWIRVGRKLKKEKPDIVIIKYWLPFMAPCFGSIARIIKSNKHTRIIAIADNIIPHEKRFFDNSFTKYFASSVDCWVAMSKSVLQDIDLFDRNSPRVLQPHPLFDNFGKPMPRNQALEELNLGFTNLKLDSNELKLDSSKPKLDSAKLNLLFFGLVREYKGLDLLLEALSDEKLKSFPIHLIVAGEFYDDYSKYEDYVKKFGLEDMVSMENKFIENDDVSKYFCACDLVVLPYKTATQSGVTQIAYHFSKPMLVTNVGGLPEIVSDGKSGYVCEPNAKSIADCLIDFCQNKRDFSQTLEIEKQRFAWDKMTAAIRMLKTKKDNFNDNKK